MVMPPPPAEIGTGELERAAGLDPRAIDVRAEAAVVAELVLAGEAAARGAVDRRHRRIGADRSVAGRAAVFVGRRPILVRRVHPGRCVRGRRRGIGSGRRVGRGRAVVVTTAGQEREREEGDRGAR
jgi:hypothetical protein